jgi:hypothetical protein
MVDSIKITALQDIGANIAYTTLVPVVNMAGTPTTQKANLQNLGNLILNGAGGSYFARAAQANIALAVANAAQPNITSLGTLTSLAVTGNITAGNINGGNIIVANFYSGNGGFLTNLPGANVSGAVGLATFATVANSVAVGNVSGIGNIATTNLTGSSSNVLYGNGVFAPIKTTPVTVSALPSASTAGAGARAFVTDATSTTFNATVVGGGSNNMPVFSNGTGWFIG